MKIQNALVSNILDRSQRYFAHVTTVTLSWRVQHIAVIGRVYFTLECFEFSSNFEFDRNMLSGTGARTTTKQHQSPALLPPLPPETDESWWRHQMETFPRYWVFVRGIHRSPVNSPHKGQWRGSLMFSLICAWTNGWVNNRSIVDLRHHHAHYVVTVMFFTWKNPVIRKAFPCH